MQTPIDALVTGFTKAPRLLERSLAPLRRLKHEGIIRNIHCVTWDSAELDSLVAPLAAMPEVLLTRMPQPDARGGANQRGVVYQIRNLEAALALVKDEALILKWRPDFIVRHAFLREKIVNFARASAVPSRASFGVTMPAPVFQQKIWIPWADSNQPFFFEDAAFLGMRGDVKHLVTALAPADMDMLGADHCGAYAHVVRYARPFLGRYPLFENYLKHYRFFRSDLDYRAKLVPHLVDNGFYWHLLIAHAWILFSQFHVDIGAAGDLLFYANNVNRDRDWSRPETLCVTSPYDDCMSWRAGTRPGWVLPSVNRPFGRVMDDNWQNAIFTAAVPDLPRDALVALLHNIACCGDGRLSEIEADFYRRLEHFHRAYLKASEAA